MNRQRLTGGQLHFRVACDKDAARARPLLHGYVHDSVALALERQPLQGQQKEKQFYVGRPEWQGVGAQQALGLADSYAALAWVLGDTGAGQ